MADVISLTITHTDNNVVSNEIFSPLSAENASTFKNIIIIVY